MVATAEPTLHPFSCHQHREAPAEQPAAVWSPDCLPAAARLPCLPSLHSQYILGKWDGYSRLTASRGYRKCPLSISGRRGLSDESSSKCLPPPGRAPSSSETPRKNVPPRPVSSSIYGTAILTWRFILENYIQEDVLVPWAWVLP